MFGHENPSNVRSEIEFGLLSKELISSLNTILGSLGLVVLVSFCEGTDQSK